MFSLKICDLKLKEMYLSLYMCNYILYPIKLRKIIGLLTLEKHPIQYLQYCLIFTKQTRRKTK